MSPDDHADLCSAILDTLGKCKPRTVSWHSPAKPVLLFTDASYEGGKSGIGAVLVDTLGGKPEIFDGEIPEDVIRHWQSTGQEQIISQAELAGMFPLSWKRGSKTLPWSCFEGGCSG